MPTLWWLRPVSSAARVGEHSGVTWKFVYCRPPAASRSMFGVSIVGAVAAEVGEARGRRAGSRRRSARRSPGCGGLGPPRRRVGERAADRALELVLVTVARHRVRLASPGPAPDLSTTLLTKHTLDKSLAAKDADHDRDIDASPSSAMPATTSGPSSPAHLAARGHDLVLGDPDDARSWPSSRPPAPRSRWSRRSATWPDPSRRRRLVAAALARFGRVDAAVAVLRPDRDRPLHPVDDRRPPHRGGRLPRGPVPLPQGGGDADDRAGRGPDPADHQRGRRPAHARARRCTRRPAPGPPCSPATWPPRWPATACR